MNVDHMCVGDGNCILNVNILGFGEVKQTINTATVVAIHANRTKSIRCILVDVVHKSNQMYRYFFIGLIHEFNQRLIIVNINEWSYVK